MNEEAIKSLKKVNEFPEIVNTIEDFIEKNDIPYKDISNNKKTYFLKVSNELKELCEEISSEDTVSCVDLYTFFKMDKRLYSKIRHSVKQDPFHLSADLKLNYSYVNGESLVWLVNNRSPELIVDFFEPIFELMPKSTKKYLTKIINTFNMTKDSTLPSNGFTCKIVQKDLPDKPNAKLLKSYYDKINHIDNYDENFFLFSHFYTLLNNKYKDCKETKVYSKLLEDVDYGVYRCFKCSHLSTNPEKIELTIKMKNILENNDFILSSIIKNFIERMGFYQVNNNLLCFIAGLKNFDDICNSDLNIYFPNFEFSTYKMNSFKTCIECALKESA